MKILVLGASGLVGWNLFQEARSMGHETVGTCRSQSLPELIHAEMADEERLIDLVREVRPDATFYCAGWSWVDGCEDDPKRAHRENAMQAATAARLASDAGSRFVYFSTSYVFDGKAGPYQECAAPAPLSVYGRSKLAGENAVLEATNGKAIIARTMGVYGREPQPKNFVFQVRKALEARQIFRVPRDQLGNVTYAPDLARMAILLVEQSHSGIWNVAGPNASIARSHFALKIAAAYGLPADLIRPLLTSALNQKALRPLQGGLTVDKAIRFTSYQPRDWMKID